MQVLSRVQHRHLCSELVSVVRPSKIGQPRTITGNLEEIGERSAVVLLETALSIGVRVRVKTKGGTLRGVVRAWAGEPLLGFFVEIALSRESRWSEKWFAPEHLLKVPSARLRSSPEAAPQVTEKILRVLPTQLHGLCLASSRTLP